MDNAVKNSKIKTIIDFSDQDTAGIRSLSVKTNNKVKITTRFIKGKMLMFSKMSIKSFVYDLIDIFSYPDEEVKEIYAKHDILKCFIYLILTDTDSCSIQFLFLTQLAVRISEHNARKLIFEILLLKKGDRLDTSDEFCEQFLCRNEKTKKQVGLYEVESVDNANLVTIAVNPKEYEIFKNKAINKKHKCIKKSTPGMNFESFASRIMDIKEYTWSQKVPAKLRQMRFQIKNTNMRLTSVNRTQFAGLNDKQYYLPDGITSLPYGHFLMSEMKEKKKQYKLTQNVIMKIKDDLIREESKIFAKCERL